MITLDKKIKNLMDSNKAILKAEIADYETLLNSKKKECAYEKKSVGIAFFANSDKSRDEIIKLKRIAEAKLNDTKAIHPIGYPYFEDVCYLELEAFEYLEEHNDLKGDKQILNVANYIAYLYWYIRRLRVTQKNVKKDRVIPPPAKEIISILSYISYKHETIAPLIRLLATFEGDYSNKIVSHSNRIAYIAEKETAQVTPPPALNKDKLSELKIEYKEKVSELYNLMKLQNPRNYKPPTKDLLKELKLPLKPSDI